MKTTAPATCDASMRTEFGTVGPCILRPQHDGPVHRDATGTTWAALASTVPSRASIAFAALLVLSCITGLTVAVIRGDWWWALAAGVGAGITGQELFTEIAERRRFIRQRSR
ncbi:hypothetical protein AB0R01_14735 [Streptomyces rochei]|uniref:hypothetical protein n=1 Tax=Streptomyces TaxID=1883 RepID=UPI001CBE03F7|nr:hypothetical protein [Streptomyces sp. A144]UAX56788.1 hypothetical protein K5X85_29105 [Streptomyces sp. A144]